MISLSPCLRRTNGTLSIAETRSCRGGVHMQHVYDLSHPYISHHHRFPGSDSPLRQKFAVLPNHRVQVSDEIDNVRI